MPLRYRLDDLGWYQFEELVQMLLKAHYSHLVESWGGRGDHGRDAYCSSSIPFPDAKSPARPPILFQCKFVENADAAGAKPDGLLLSAIRKEMRRAQQHLASGSWHRRPNTFVLCTNVDVTPPLRQALVDIVSGSVLSLSRFHLLAGKDVSDLLDAKPSLAQRFPQLLGLRDLRALLADAVNADVVRASEAAIELAAELVEVFVPTKPYQQTWATLKDHHFAVLAGPPEMGKTTIAWLIALAQVYNGWRAVVCRSPEDLFGTYDANGPQVFVTDDTFGRTEFDPQAGRRWEAQLHLVLPKLNRDHWLVWTTRKHILEHALRRLDLEEPGTKRVRVSEVIVEANNLSPLERALILYRHARAAQLSTAARNDVRSLAGTIVSDKHFTPERVRRLIRDDLPVLSSDESIGVEEKRKRVQQALRHPTQRMAKAFKSLPNDAKYSLLALVEAEESRSVRTATEAYERLTSGTGRSLPEVFEELKETFLAERKEYV